MSEKWGYRVSYLTLRRSAIAANHEVIGKCLQALDLKETKSPVLPVKRSDVWTRLRLDRRSRLVWIELQKKAPVALPPLENRLRVPALLCVEEVVVARRNAGQ